jgi:hypothetical protein
MTEHPVWLYLFGNNARLPFVDEQTTYNAKLDDVIDRIKMVKREREQEQNGKHF